MRQRRKKERKGRRKGEREVTEPYTEWARPQVGDVGSHLARAHEGQPRKQYLTKRDGRRRQPKHDDEPSFHVHQGPRGDER